MIRTYLKFIPIYEATTIITVGNPVRCTWRNYKKARFGSQKELPIPFEFVIQFLVKYIPSFKADVWARVLNEWSAEKLILITNLLSNFNSKIWYEYNNNYYCILFSFFLNHKHNRILYSWVYFMIITLSH